MVAVTDRTDLERGYVITRDMADFSVLPIDAAQGRARLLKVPAPLACYWLGQSEVLGASRPLAAAED